MGWRDLFGKKEPEDGDHLDGCEADFTHEHDLGEKEREALLVPEGQEDTDGA